MQYAVETFSLTKIFSDWWGRSKVLAVDNLNLKVHINEVFGLLGPNGSGKTTTLKVLLGLLYPTKGKTLVLGGDSTDPKISARIGFLPEESYLYRYLNARETLDFYGRLFGLPSKIRKTRIEALLEMVGLTAVANRPVGTFSKGMARRIGLAAALINDPDLLILDEPTTGLDPIGTRQIKDLILQLAKRGKTILLCSHLLADVEDICDRISILYGGKVQAEGKVAQLLRQTNKKQFITGNITDNTVEKIKQLVESENAECVVTSPLERLETFFIKTVTQAQRQAQPTSGAVSTTQIGNFLTAGQISESKTQVILDKLVSADLSQPSPPEPPKTEKVAKTETIETKPDEQLLSTLTNPITPVTATPTEPQKTDSTPVEAKDTEKEQVDKNLLDKLVEPAQTTPVQKENKSTENQRGDSTDA